MDKEIGRYLTKEENIHHINHIKTDNREENLMITDNYTHPHLHPEVHKKQKIEFKGKHFSPGSEFKNVRTLDSKTIRRYAERFSMENVKKEYQQWFEDLTQLYKSTDGITKGWSKI